MFSSRLWLSRLFLLFSFLLTGCSSTLLTRDDYAPSLTALKINNPKLALEKFPDGERGGFITTMEKTYLSLLTGKTDLSGLEHFSKQIENRVRYDVSRELGALFYVKTAEGYYASEHEIIWMHFLLSWGYTNQGKSEKACVEARKASHLLSAEWSEEGHFDDPMMRVILGVMWHLCGDWQEARVDFRRAYYLNKEMQWAMQLADMETAPADIWLGLVGVGAEPFWNAELDAKLSNLQHIDFRLSTSRDPLNLVYQNPEPFYLTSSSLPWYQRHRERDNAISELVSASQYSGEVLLASGIEAAKTTAAITYAVTAGILISAAGLEIMKLAADASSGSGDAFIAGLSMVLYGPVYATNTIKRSTNDAANQLDKDFDSSGSYRFVRFLPEYLWLRWSNNQAEVVHPFDSNNQAVKNRMTYQSGDSKIHLFHFSNHEVDQDEIDLNLSAEKHKHWMRQLNREMKAQQAWDRIEQLNQLEMSLRATNKGRVLRAEERYDRNYFEVEIRQGKLSLVIKHGIFVFDESISFDIGSQQLLTNVQADSEFLKYKPEQVVTIIKALSSRIR